MGGVVCRLQTKGQAQGALRIGAGCSESAGIPLAKGILELIEKDDPEYWKGVKPRNYENWMGKLGETQRRDLVLSVVSGKAVNLAHLAIATMIRDKIIDRVITTNFDPLLIKACGLLGVETAFYDADALLNDRFRVLDIGLPAILYVHGQYCSFTQRHTRADYTRKHSQLLRKLFETLSQTHTWIVVGYSGKDPTAKSLTRLKEFSHELHWVGLNKNPPSRFIQNNLLLPSKKPS